MVVPSPMRVKGDSEHAHTSLGQHDIHKLKMTVRYGAEQRLSELSGRGLFESISACVEDLDEYVEEKRALSS